MIQIMLSHPQPSELVRLKPFPHPPQKKSKRIIQMMELQQPLLELLEVLHPQAVAVKSLIVLPPRVLCFIMVYHM